MPRGVRRVAPPDYTVAQPAPVEDALQPERAPNQPPADWRKGALLNVRNRGDAYVVTLYPEEFDERYPARALRFTNPGECQDFVSRWYTAEHHDPRAR